ncbi:hypothetical protein GGF32_005974 [Allomyces javanicus]|nr:hypothetical protein GGF32_005974 [Allomyces javanicus]
MLTLNSYLKLVKPDVSVQFMSMIIGDKGMVILNGDRHKVHRQIANPLFNLRTLNPLVPIMLIALDELFAVIDQTPPSTTHAFHDLSSRLTLNVIGRTTMDHDFDALGPRGSRMARAYRAVMRNMEITFGLAMRIQFPNTLGRIPTAARREHAAGYRVVEDMVKDLLRAADKKPDGATLIHELVRQNAGNVLDEHELVCQVRSFLAAGLDTTAAALSACVLLLAQHPDVQQELFDEVDAVADLEDYEVLRKLPRLNSVINETLRLYTPVHMSLRETAAEVVVPTAALGPVTLPKGIRVEIPTRAIHSDSAIWGDDALTWNPQRWDSINLVHGTADVSTHRILNGRRQIGPYDFMPFQVGPRACIGRQFALMELRLFVSGIVKGYALATDVPIDGLDIVCSMSMRVTNAWVRMERRS